MDKVWDQMKSGAWYDAEDVSLRQLRASCKAKLQQFNAMPESDRQQAIGILYTLLDAQEGLNIEAPFRCDYGPNIHLGRNFYANFNFSVLDEADVTIGDHVFIGPNVGIYTAIHPLDPKTRKTGLERAEPVRIGDARGDDRQPQCHRRRQRGHARYPGRCGRGGKSMPCHPQPERRAG